MLCGWVRCSKLLLLTRCDPCCPLRADRASPSFPPPPSPRPLSKRSVGLDGRLAPRRCSARFCWVAPCRTVPAPRRVSPRFALVVVVRLPPRAIPTHLTEYNTSTHTQARHDPDDRPARAMFSRGRTPIRQWEGGPDVQFSTTQRLSLLRTPFRTFSKTCASEPVRTTRPRQRTARFRRTRFDDERVGVGETQVKARAGITQTKKKSPVSDL